MQKPYRQRSATAALVSSCLLRMKKSTHLAQPQAGFAMAATFVTLAAGFLQVVDSGRQGMQEFRQRIVRFTGPMGDIEPTASSTEPAGGTAVIRRCVATLEIDIALDDPARKVEQTVHIA